MEDTLVNIYTEDEANYDVHTQEMRHGAGYFERLWNWWDDIDFV